VRKRKSRQASGVARGEAAPRSSGSGRGAGAAGRGAVPLAGGRIVVDARASGSAHEGSARAPAHDGQRGGTRSSCTSSAHRRRGGRAQRRLMLERGLQAALAPYVDRQAREACRARRRRTEHVAGRDPARADGRSRSDREARRTRRTRSRGRRPRDDAWRGGEQHRRRSRRSSRRVAGRPARLPGRSISAAPSRQVRADAPEPRHLETSVRHARARKLAAAADHAWRSPRRDGDRRPITAESTMNRLNRSLATSSFTHRHALRAPIRWSEQRKTAIGYYTTFIN
jgi:hypothetical protein